MWDLFDLIGTFEVVAPKFWAEHSPVGPRNGSNANGEWGLQRGTFGFEEGVGGGGAEVDAPVDGALAPKWAMASGNQGHRLQRTFFGIRGGVNRRNAPNTPPLGEGDPRVPEGRRKRSARWS